MDTLTEYGSTLPILFLQATHLKSNVLFSLELLLLIDRGTINVDAG